MSELYINIMIVLIAFVLGNFIRTRYAGRISINIWRVVYIIAIVYFVFNALYYPIDSNHVKRIIQITFPMAMVGYLVYKLTSLRNRTS